MRRVLKWTMQVNDEWQPIGRGRVVHVESQYGNRDLVMIWTEEECSANGPMLHPADRAALIIGTGQPVPDLTEHLGSVIPDGAHGHLVWHVYGAAR